MGAHREAAAAAAAGRRGPTRSDAKLHAGDVGYAPRQRVPRGVAKIRGLEGAAPLAAAADGGGRDSAAQRSAARAAAASTRRLAHQHAAADGASLGSHAIGDDVAEASESGSDTDAAVAAAAAAAASAAAAAAPSPPSPAAAAAAAAALAPAPRPAAPPHPHPPSPAGEHGGGGGALRLRLRAALRRLPKPLRHLLAGAVSGGVAKTATSPLEVVRMRLMVSKGSATVASVVAQTWAAAGPAGFWAGNGADVLRTAPQKSVQLASFDFYKRLLSRRDPETGAAVLPGWASTAAGSLAGVTSTIACFPLEVLRTRLACAPHAAASTAAGSAAAGAAAAARPAAAAAPGLASAALALIREGPTALFAGLAPSLLGVIPYAGINLGAYDGLRLAAAAALGLASPAALPKSAALVIGAVAGVTASTATFPLEVVRRRMMLGACPQFGGNTWKALVGIARAEGFGALFRGCLLNWVKLAPSAGVSFYVYEEAKDWLGLNAAGGRGGAKAAGAGAAA